GARPLEYHTDRHQQILSSISNAADYNAGRIFVPKGKTTSEVLEASKEDFERIRKWEDNATKAQRIRGDIIRLTSFLKMKGDSLTEMEKVLEQVLRTRDNLRAQLYGLPGQ
ncbi:unnamed protein product, partial [Heterosigma akashiwo]